MCQELVDCKEVEDLCREGMDAFLHPAGLPSIAQELLLL